MSDIGEVFDQLNKDVDDGYPVDPSYIELEIEAGANGELDDGNT